jgi:3-oxoacyl-[acyl-carrier-protein] synthase I
VVVGFDPLSRFVSTGFHALGALSSSVARPFDRTRDGLSLGEGAAVAVLVRRTPEKGDICLDGAGSSNDANHRTGPSRTGEGLLRAARMALETADLAPENVGAVKCHGTATLYNDAMEAKALQALFGNTIPPCASFKGALGHTSGGGALLEVLIASHLLRARTLAPTVGFAELGVEEPIPISATKQAFSTPSLLCLSAGFGGVNAAIALSETCS